MKKFIILITIASMFVITSCGNGSEAVKTSSVDSLKKDSVPAKLVAVDTTVKKVDSTSTKK